MKPVKGENASGEMTFAREHMLEIIPWAFPYISYQKLEFELTNIQTNLT